MNKIKVQLLTGACGYEAVQADGSIRRGYKTPADGPFLCPALQALKMIRSGQAKALDPAAVPVKKVSAASGLEALTLKELKQMADEAGLAYGSRTTKAELIEALEEENA